MPMPASDLCWWRPLRTLDSVAVVLVDLHPHSKRETEALRWLDCTERNRWQRYEFDGPRRRFLLCRAALRALLCEQLRCENEQLAIATTRYGKPFANVDSMPAPIGFNVSHSGRYGLIAVSRRGRLGVDIEERDATRDLSLLIDTVLSEKERAELDSKQGAEKTHLFFRLWTFKEALLKACGLGFHLDATSIDIPTSLLRGMEQSKVQIPQVPVISWHVEDLGNENFAAAIAYEVVVSPLEKD